MAEVLEQLGVSGLRPISIKPIRVIFEAKKSLLGRSINAQDQIFLTKYLSLMLKVGTDLFRAIDILVDDFDKPAVKALLMEIRSNLEKGKQFYTTFANYPKVFSPVFVNMIKAGEQSGNLDNVLENLSVSIEKTEALKSRVKGAMIYPSVLMGAATLILILLVSFALPKLAEVFSGGGIEPPTFSRIVFAIGFFFGKYVWFILSALAFMSVGFVVLFRTNLAFKTVVSRFVRKLPVVKKVSHRLGIQRFASTLSSLMKAGLPIVEALEITADATGHDEIRAALLRVSREGITKGLGIGESFKREVIFPKVVTNLIAISEKSGHIEEVLDTVAKFYEDEVDDSLKIMVSLLEPILLVGIGGIVAAIALAIIVPIYQLVGQF